MLKIMSKTDISEKLLSTKYKKLGENYLSTKHETYFVDGFYFRKGPFHNLLLSQSLKFYVSSLAFAGWR